VLQSDLLQALAAALPEGGELFLQSDVTAVIEPMVALTEASGWFLRPPEDGRPWRSDNPLPVATERERIVLAHGLPVYRVLYRRGGQPCLHPQLPLEPRADGAHNPSASPAGS
jgi:tRNA (guanine-N7-)-methyltransferase